MPAPQQATPSPMMGGTNPLGASGIQTNGSPSAPSGADPLSQSLAAEAKANPGTVSVTAPTKFGKLAKLMAPILEGGAVGAVVGGATGKSTYGGGFAGAQNFFSQQNQRQLQNAMVQRQTANDIFHNALLTQQAQLDQARTQRQMQQPLLQGRSIQPTAATNAQGNKVLISRDPYDPSKFNEVDGYTPAADKDTDSFELHDTDQGVIKMDRKKGKITQATIGGDDDSQDDATGKIPSKLPSRFNSGSPRVAGTNQSGVSSTMSTAGTKLTKSKTQKEENPDAQDFTYLTTPKEQGGMGLTPDQAHSRMHAQDRKPDKPAADPDAPLVGDKYRKVQMTYETQLNQGFSKIATNRQHEIAALDKKKDELDPDDYDKQRQQIEDDNADAKQELHQRLHDEAQGKGVDLGTVPDYRNQAGGGKATATTANAAPASAGAKTVTPDIVQAWATKKKIPLAEAQKQFKAKGYTVGGAQ